MSNDTYQYTDSDGDRLVVDEGGTGNATVSIRDDETAKWYSVYLPNDEAPAFALAVLEAAGYSADALYNTMDRRATPLEWAVVYLKRHAAKQTKVKEEAKLDREAEVLYEASFAEPGERSGYPGWGTLHERGKDSYRNIARQAREMYATEAGE